MINPEVIFKGKKLAERNEGCLSYPGVVARVERPKTIRVRYEDENRETKFRTLTGMTARICLHEIDHLDGKLFIDYLSSLKRNMMLKKVKKLTK